MALFGKKKQNEEEVGGEQEGAAPKGKSAFAPDPDKAARWFEHARTQHETANYEYAATCWLKGLAFDPANMEALEGFLHSAQAFASTQKRPGPSKDQVKSFETRSPVDKYVVSLLQWGTGKPLDPGQGVKATEAAASLGLSAATRWIGELALRSARGDKKPRKEHFVKLKDQFVRAEAYDLATKAGEDACALDPNDAELKEEVRNLSAQSAMTTGGYEESGEEGGFRKNIRDAEAQRRIREQTQVVKTEDVAARVVEASRADYEARPLDTHAIGKYVRALVERGGDDDERTALEVLQKAYEGTKEFRWRQQYGDLVIRRERRKVAELKRQSEEDASDPSVKERYAQAQRTLLEEEAKEFQVRVDAYPTDTRLKYELGRRLFMLGRYADAIKHLQEAQSDAKIRTPVLSYLGQAFLKLGWHAEASDMLRRAIESHHSTNDDMAMDLRYALMVALESKAREERDLTAAEEAGKLASSLAMQRFDFRDVVDRRQALQTLAKELRDAGVA